MSFLFHAIFYDPIYNGLILFINIIPLHNVGLAAILFTCVIKIIIFPLSQKAVKTQFAMKQIEPEINELKLKHKDNKQLQAEKTMLLYKEKGINPFAGIFATLIQLPILMALYWVFLKGGLPNVDPNSLYPFIKVPSIIDMDFFGVSVTAKSFWFAICVAFAQFLQMQITMPKNKTASNNAKKEPSFGDELAKSMNMQAKYVMPIIMFFIARSFPIVVSLYLITSSFFAIGQELYVRNKYKKEIGQVAKN